MWAGSGKSKRGDALLKSNMEDAKKKHLAAQQSYDQGDGAMTLFGCCSPAQRACMAMRRCNAQHNHVNLWLSDQQRSESAIILRYSASRRNGLHRHFVIVAQRLHYWLIQRQAGGSVHRPHSKQQACKFSYLKFHGTNLI